jgi:hypothetical protein
LPRHKQVLFYWAKEMHHNNSRDALSDLDAETVARVAFLINPGTMAL